MLREVRVYEKKLEALKRLNDVLSGKVTKLHKNKREAVLGSTTTEKV